MGDDHVVQDSDAEQPGGGDSRTRPGHAQRGGAGLERAAGTGGSRSTVVTLIEDGVLPGFRLQLTSPRLGLDPHRRGSLAAASVSRTTSAVSPSSAFRHARQRVVSSTDSALRKCGGPCILDQALAEDFFPPPPPRPKLEPTPVIIPEWRCPPLDEPGRAEPVRLVLGQSDRAVVAVMGLVIYSTGMVLRTAGLLREPFRGRQPIVASPHTPDSDSLLKLGVEWPDGARATNLDRDLPYAERPGGPVVHPLPGAPSPHNRGDGRIAHDWWIWPLPGPGFLTLYCEWSDAGIAVSQSRLDVTPLLRGVRRA